MNLHRGTVVVAMGLVMLACGSAHAASVILPGMLNYTYTVNSAGAGVPSTSQSGATISDPYAVSYRAADVADVWDTTGTPLEGVPTYVWWNGCSPTAAGMIVAYWDSLPGYENLYYGDASGWYGSGNGGTRRMVASTAHTVSGHQNDYIYGDYHNSASYPNHEANPNCIADFLHTVNGATGSGYIATGLKNYIEWTDPSTTDPLKAGYACTIADNYATAWRSSGALDISNVTTEIDAGRPLLLSVYTSCGVTSTAHSLVAYGYQADMFQIRVQTGASTYENQTAYGIAVRDTWDNGTTMSEWYDWEGDVVSAHIDGNGVEWWPFVCYTRYNYSALNDWTVYNARAINIAGVPEPSSLLLAVLGLIGLLAYAWKRRLGIQE